MGGGGGGASPASISVTDIYRGMGMGSHTGVKLLDSSLGTPVANPRQ